MTGSYPQDTPQERAFRAFEALVASEDASIDLALAALFIASAEYPDLNIVKYMAQLDSLALRVCGLLGLPEPATLTEFLAESDLLQAGSSPRKSH